MTLYQLIALDRATQARQPAVPPSIEEQLIAAARRGAGLDG